MTRLRFFALLLASGLSLFASAAEAIDQIKFLQTAPRVFQDTTLTTKIIVSSDVPGLLVVVGEPTEVQQFHPAYVRRGEKTQSFFIGFNEKNNNYTELFVGSKSYRLNAKGFFSAELGSTRISVDNSNPYLSIVREDPDNKKAPAIIGFRGLSVVVNSSGNEVVALLEANQLSGLQGVVKPYQVVESGLMLAKSPVRTNLIGVAPQEVRNKCLDSEKVVFLDESDRQAIKAASKQEQLKLLAQIVGRDEGARTPFENSIILRITKDQIIALDYQRALAQVIRDMKSNSPYVLCSVTKIEL